MYAYHFSKIVVRKHIYIPFFAARILFLVFGDIVANSVEKPSFSLKLSVVSNSGEIPSTLLVNSSSARKAEDGPEVSPIWLKRYK